MAVEVVRVWPKVVVGPDGVAYYVTPYPFTVATWPAPRPR